MQLGNRSALWISIFLFYPTIALTYPIKYHYLPIHTQDIPYKTKRLAKKSGCGETESWDIAKGGFDAWV